MKKIFWTLLLVFTFSCTENQRVKSFGGKMDVELKPNEEFVNITWKNDEMWVLTKDTLTNIYYFRENSSFGIWEGEVIIK